MRSSSETAECVPEVYWEVEEVVLRSDELAAADDAPSGVVVLLGAMLVEDGHEPPLPARIDQEPID